MIGISLFSFIVVETSTSSNELESALILAKPHGGEQGIQVILQSFYSPFAGFARPRDGRVAPSTDGPSPALPVKYIRLAPAMGVARNRSRAGNFASGAFACPAWVRAGPSAATTLLTSSPARA